MTIVRTRNLFSTILLLSLFSTFLSVPRAQADSVGDAAMTVTLSTVAGAVLGASTLPFYEESGEHTKNIFYGAAIGAVIGVFICAYAGVKEGPDYGDEARLAPRRPSALSLNEAPALRLHAEATTATRRPASFGAGTTLVWQPVASLKF